MLKIYLALVLLAAAVFAESVRETETWVPLKNKSPSEDLEASGDSPNGDFEFSDVKLTTDDEDGFDEEEDDDDDDVYDDEEDEMSGSGDAALIPDYELKPDINNWIPEDKLPVAPKPTVNDEVLIQKNEVGLAAAPNHDGYQPNNVLMSHAGDEGFFSNKEVLAAVIAGGLVGLIFAVLLIVLLVHFVLRIKKKDEGSYDLVKTPIYKRAPTTEIYA